MAKIKVTSVNNTENIFKIILSENGVVVNHTSITSAELRTSDGKTIASSITDPSDWNFTNAGFLTVKFGQASVSAGTYTCKLIIRDATHLVGIAWDTDIVLTILP